LQEAYEEGRFMGDLAKNIFLIMDWTFEKIESIVHTERLHSSLKYKLKPLDDIAFDNLNPRIHIYLTGDNTTQPGNEIISHLINAQEINRPKIEQVIANYGGVIKDNAPMDAISLTSNFFLKISENLNALDRGVNKLMKKMVNRQISRKVKKISNQ
jgi:hypothetical protein